MTSIRPFRADDIFKFNSTNLDPLTETYDLNFYFSYLAKWPHLFHVVEGTNGRINGYIMGKLESSPAYLRFSPHHLPFHAHMTALTVAPAARRQGLARLLSASLERAGDAYGAWFVDLFVRRSNGAAQRLYRGMGYRVFRAVRGYYVDDPARPDLRGEDAFDMRRPLRRDRARAHVRETGGEQVVVEPGDVW